MPPCGVPGYGPGAGRLTGALRVHVCGDSRGWVPWTSPLFTCFPGAGQGRHPRTLGARLIWDTEQLAVHTVNDSPRAPAKRPRGRLNARADGAGST